MYKPLPKQLTIKKSPIEGLNVFKGEVTYKAVADAFGYKYISPNELIS